MHHVHTYIHIYMYLFWRRKNLISCPIILHTSSPLLQLSILFLSEERACEQHHDLSLCVSITERLYLSQSQESRDYTVIILSLNFLLPNSVPAPYHHQQQIFPFSFIFPILFPADNIITTNRSIHIYKLYINFVVSKHIFLLF